MSECERMHVKKVSWTWANKASPMARRRSRVSHKTKLQRSNLTYRKVPPSRSIERACICCRRLYLNYFDVIAPADVFSIWNMGASTSKLQVDWRLLWDSKHLWGFGFEHFPLKAMQERRWWTLLTIFNFLLFPGMLNFDRNWSFWTVSLKGFNLRFCQ